METNRAMTRGQLAKAAEVNAETVRFYEKKGLSHSRSDQLPGTGCTRVRLLYASVL